MVDHSDIENIKPVSSAPAPARRGVYQSGLTGDVYKVTFPQRRRRVREPPPRVGYLGVGFGAPFAAPGASCKLYGEAEGDFADTARTNRKDNMVSVCIQTDLTACWPGAETTNTSGASDNEVTVVFRKVKPEDRVQWDAPHKRVAVPSSSAVVTLPPADSIRAVAASSRDTSAIAAPSPSVPPLSIPPMPVVPLRAAGSSPPSTASAASNVPALAVGASAVYDDGRADDPTSPSAEQPDPDGGYILDSSPRDGYLSGQWMTNSLVSEMDPTSGKVRVFADPLVTGPVPALRAAEVAEGVLGPLSKPITVGGVNFMNIASPAIAAKVATYPPRVMRRLNWQIYHSFMGIGGDNPADVTLFLQLFERSGKVVNGHVVQGGMAPVRLPPQDGSRSVTVLSVAPPVLYLNPVIDLETCEYLKEQARAAGLVASQMGSADSHSHSGSGRSSTNAFLVKSGTPRLAEIEKHFAKVLGVVHDELESLQVVKYTPGQEFRPHWDSYDLKTIVGREIMGTGRQRVLSMFVILGEPVRLCSLFLAHLSTLPTHAP